MIQFESILKQTENSSKIDYWKLRFKYRYTNLKNILFNPLYWLRCKLSSRRGYHILDLTKGGNGYTQGWYDTDTRMLQACFLLLVEYVECEKPFEVIDWDFDEASKQKAAEIKELYDWWKTGRAEKRAALTKEWNSLPKDESSKFIPVEGGGFTVYIPESHKVLKAKEDALTEEDQRNLERLVKIRGWLWT